jgi:hypothetical protein
MLLLLSFVWSGGVWSLRGVGAPFESSVDYNEGKL